MSAAKISFLLYFTANAVKAGATGQISVPNTFPDLTSCLSQPSFFSCENTTAIKNSCCSPTPGGLVLQTQFWDTYTGLERQGQKSPKGSWTIHGLWPDNCDGSFEQYCDLSRQYDRTPSPAILPDGTVVPPYTGPGVDTFIKAFGREDLLEYMNNFWVSQGSPNTDFWGHEFSKHATCTSTFDVACYGPGYRKHQEVVNFFDAVVRAFHQYPTFDMLAAAGIVPSNKTTYTLIQLQTAIKSQTGSVPFFGCTNNGTVLSEVWYFSHVFGTEKFSTVVDGETLLARTIGTIRHLQDGGFDYEIIVLSEWWYKIFGASPFL